MLLTPQEIRFLRRVVGLTASRAQLEEILNAPTTDVYSVEVVYRQAPWVVQPDAAGKSKKGWPIGVKRSIADRLTPRTGRPRSIKSV